MPMPVPVASAPASWADLAVRGGPVWTMDADRPEAEAVAIRAGVVVYVGPDAGLTPFVGPDTEVIDASGGRVLPGFVDAHVHPAEGGVELGQCSLGDAGDADAVLAEVRRCADASRGRGWLVGAGWQLTAFPGGTPPAGALDAAVGDRPVYLLAADGHSAWVNARALAKAGITADTPDPPGGRIERGPDGAATGVLREDAVDLVGDAVPEPSVRTWVDGIAQAVALAHRAGLTTLVEAHAYGRMLRAYRRLDRQGALTARVTADLDVDPALGPGQVDRLVRQRRRFTGAQFRPIGAKIFVDGVMEARTAAMLAPYTDTGTPGDPLWTDDALQHTVRAVASAGFDVQFHAIGDRAVRMALDAVAAARAGGSADEQRFAIAHLELVDPADLPRFGALGVDAVFQPLWAQADAYVVDLTVPGVGPERAARLYPIGAAAAAGAPLAFGSDWSVSDLAPLAGVEVALTRCDGAPPCERLGDDPPIDVHAAFDAYTRGAARVAHRDDAGVLRVGAVGDLVVLGADPAAVPASAIGDLPVVATVVGGRVVWRAP